MSRVVLVTGGCRSGKSTRALEIASSYGRKVFVATAEATDGEMAERIRRHRMQRDASWRTVEEPLDLAGALASLGPGAEIAVVDCLTVWIANLFHHEDRRRAGERMDDLVAWLASPSCDVVLVTNEVGMGIVPADEETRWYRDAAGSLNQRVAAVADEVILMVSGVPVTIKGERT